MGIDTKIISLYKLHIPKTKSFEKLINKSINEKDTIHRYYVTMGHYDLIDIAEFKPDFSDEDHLLNQIHNFVQLMHGFDSIVDKDSFSSQNLIVFTDIIENNSDKSGIGFTDTEINNFWNNDSHDKLFFVSMLHINDFNTQSKEVELSGIIEYIKDCYGVISYLYYFTFDYSDIIIFSRPETVDQYINIIYKLNYTDRGKMVRDSFTLFGICRSYLVDMLKKLKNIEEKVPEEEFKKKINNFVKGGSIESEKNNPENSENIKEDNTFFLKVNIGVQNHTILENFIKDISILEDDSNTQQIRQIGRNDYSVINSKATKHWLIYIEYLIDKYTQEKEGKNADAVTSRMVFSTFEAYLGYSYKNNMRDISDSDSVTIINTDKLTDICSDFENVIKDYFPKNAANYYLPIKEVVNSIKSIVKNQFADDFVVCMYESFYRFVEYMKCKIIKMPKNGSDYCEDEDFSRSFNEYFKGLISLVNSAMHADRSFIQATAFNAILYDIPPKLMSFYTSIVYNISKIMRDENEFNYSFLFTPNFSDDITLSIVSYPPIEPEDRLLFISINETFFYNPSMVISTVAHEIAHLVGNKKRCRNERLEGYIRCIIFMIFYEYLLDGDYLHFDLSMISLILDVNKKVCSYLFANVEKAEKAMVYLYQYIDIIDNMLMLISYDPTIDKLAENYINKSIGDKNKCSLHIVHNPAGYLYKIYRTRIATENQTEYNSGYNRIIAQLSYVEEVYRESYSDLQMILLLKLTYKDYIDKVTIHERISDKNLLEPHNFNRIISVIMTIETIGMWDINEIKSYTNNVVTDEIAREIINTIKQVNYYCSINDVRKEYKIENLTKCVRNEYINFCNAIGDNVNTGHIHFVESSSIDAGSFLRFEEYVYLLYAIRETLDNYKNKVNEITHLRETYKTITEFNSISEVYKSIRKEMEIYKSTLSEIM